ncbi:hypothetical protein ACEOWJ_003241 [Bacillus cereus]
MRNIKEEDLDFLKDINGKRLRPDKIRFFFGGVFAYTSIPMLIMFLGVLLNGDKISLSLFEKIVVRTEAKLYILEFIFLIIYMFPKVAFKLQKFQTIVILFFSIQLCTLPFMALVIRDMFGFPYNNNTLVYLSLLLLGAIAMHIVATVDIFRKVKHGGDRLEGEAISFFTNSNSRVLIGMVTYVIVLLILIFVSINFVLKPMVLYTLQTFILYAVAIKSSEFVLLAYCRFKFPSFNITWEQHKKEY